MPGFLSVWEVLVLMFVILLVFGAKRLPALGRSMGRGMREFKEGLTEGRNEGTAELRAATDESAAAAARTSLERERFSH
jgi:sec-independent protein translocase protein TatA